MDSRLHDDLGDICFEWILLLESIIFYCIKNMVCDKVDLLNEVNSCESSKELIFEITMMEKTGMSVLCIKNDVMIDYVSIGVGLCEIVLCTMLLSNGINSISYRARCCRCLM